MKKKVLALLLLVACGDETHSADGGNTVAHPDADMGADARVIDAATADSGPNDVGGGTDAPMLDVGVDAPRDASVATSCSDWNHDAAFDPPPLDADAEFVEITVEHRVLLESGADIHPSNYVYDVVLPDADTDYVVYTNLPLPLTEVVRVSGGKQVRLIGLDIRPIVQRNGLPEESRWGGIGTVSENGGDGRRDNVHPRIPLSGGLVLTGMERFVLEGVLVDIGHHAGEGGAINGDTIISNTGVRWGAGGSAGAIAGGLANFDGYLFNSRLVNGVGTDRIHADVMHHQNSTWRHFRAENVTLGAPSQGITWQRPTAHSGNGGTSVRLRRVNWIPEPLDIVNNGQRGASLWSVDDDPESPEWVDWEEVFLGNPWAGADVVFKSIQVDNARYWAADDASGTSGAVPVNWLSAGHPPEGDFATESSLRGYGRSTSPDRPQSCFP